MCTTVTMANGSKAKCKARGSKFLRVAIAMRCVSAIRVPDLSLNWSKKEKPKLEHEEKMETGRDVSRVIVRACACDAAGRVSQRAPKREGQANLCQWQHVRRSILAGTPRVCPRACTSMPAIVSPAQVPHASVYAKGSVADFVRTCPALSRQLFLGSPTHVGVSLDARSRAKSTVAAPTRAHMAACTLVNSKTTRNTGRGDTRAVSLPGSVRGCVVIGATQCQFVGLCCKSRDSARGRLGGSGRRVEAAACCRGCTIILPSMRLADVEIFVCLLSCVSRISPQHA